MGLIYLKPLCKFDLAEASIYSGVFNAGSKLAHTIGIRCKSVAICDVSVGYGLNVYLEY